MHPTPARRKSLDARLSRLAAVALVVVGVWPAPDALAQGYGDGVQGALGPQFLGNPYAQRPFSPSPHDRSPRGMVMHWNEVTVDASGLDHAPVAAGEPRVFGEQLGPARASRAMAIVHIAVFEAINAVRGHYRSYVGLPHAMPGTSPEVAIAQAAHDTLSALFPSQQATFAAQLAHDLDAEKNAWRRALGVDLGRRAAAAILAMRAGDGSAHRELRLGNGPGEYATSSDPGKWRQDPVSMVPIALGARWDEVEPFVMMNARQFRVPLPPGLASPEYALAYDEVQRLGGDGIHTPTQRTPEQSEIGIFWAYDGTPSLCAPPRLYNQIAMKIATDRNTDVVDLARLLALVNTAMADAAIAIWESKYFYEFWRPVTGIRKNDGNPWTAADAGFMPMGAPASNLTGPNFTPPFPAYPSGHAGFGGALFQTLRRFFGTDAIAFSFVSDEFNGITVDNDGNVRRRIQRTFRTLSEAEEENGQSRIYLGIHWSFDKREGILQGRRVADYVFEHAFQPRR
jgi:PAP2 superfamily